MKQKNVNKGGAVAFSAINPYQTTNIVSPQESAMSGKDYISWGDGNQYPEYLYGLYDAVPTLASVINGCVDYVCGNGVDCTNNLQGDAMNREGETCREIVEQLARDYFLYGGFALQVIRSLDRQSIAEIYAIPLRFLRVSEGGESFYYSEEWAKRSSKAKALVYPKFIQGGQNESEILYVKNVRTQNYPKPLYTASVKPCEIEKQINDFHLNAILNGFTGGFVVNFNNGEPNDPEIKAEIEKDFNQKWAGASNAGRSMLCWNASKDYATTFERLEVQDFGAKYEALQKRSASQIFTSFRANPNLFGIATENNGFNAEEYNSSFKLFNRTMIRPAQIKILEALGKVLGAGSVTIRPFSLEE